MWWCCSVIILIGINFAPAFTDASRPTSQQERRQKVDRLKNCVFELLKCAFEELKCADGKSADFPSGNAVDCRPSVVGLTNDAFEYAIWAFEQPKCAFHETADIPSTKTSDSPSTHQGCCSVPQMRIWVPQMHISGHARLQNRKEDGESTVSPTAHLICWNARLRSCWWDGRQSIDFPVGESLVKPTGKTSNVNRLFYRPT